MHLIMSFHSVKPIPEMTVLDHQEEQNWLKIRNIFLKINFTNTSAVGFKICTSLCLLMAQHLMTLVIAVSADGLSPYGARPSAGTVMPTNLGMFSLNEVHCCRCCFSSTLPTGNHASHLAANRPNLIMCWGWSFWCYTSSDDLICFLLKHLILS